MSHSYLHIYLELPILIPILILFFILQVKNEFRDSKVDFTTIMTTSICIKVDKAFEVKTGDQPQQSMLVWTKMYLTIKLYLFKITMMLNIKNSKPLHCFFYEVFKVVLCESEVKVLNIDRE